jgi:hypothetical protein
MTPRLPLIGVIAAIALAFPTADALRDLARARQDRDAARAALAQGRPGPVAAAALALPADGAADARRRLAARVRADAAQGGVLVEAIAADTAVPDALAALTLRASGPEKAVVAFADTLERGRRPVRLLAWRMTPAPGGVRLDARLVAPWRG